MFKTLINAIKVACVLCIFISNISASNFPNAEIIYNKGVRIWFGNTDEKDEVKACKMFKEAAEYEYPNALFNYAQCVREGVSGGKDIHRALDYYRRALALGVDESAIAIAAIILYEQKDKTKYEEARHLLMKYINDHPDDSMANFSLGNIYYMGLGVNVDIGKAMEYYAVSAASGNPLAIALFYEVYRKGLNGYEVDEKSSENWKNHFININNLYIEDDQMSLQYALDKLYKEGWGLKKHKE